MRARLAPSALVLALAALPVHGALAAPISFGVQSGSLTLSASVGGSRIADPVTLDLDGAALTLDPAANELTSLSLTSSDLTALTLSPGYAGFDTLTLDRFSLSGGPGTLSLVSAGPPDEHFFALDPAVLEVDASLSNSVTLVSVPVETFTTATVASGTLFLDEAAGVVSLDGIAFGEIGPLGEETEPIVLKGDLRAIGSTQAPVPEPSAALAFAVGLAAVAGAVRSRRRA